MPEEKRVYPSNGNPSKWLGYAMLFLCAVVLLSGLAAPGGGARVEIQPTPTATPVPMDAAFDETPESREIDLPARSWYALQLGAFESEEAARELAERFRARGAAGYLWRDERLRVLAALYLTKDDAQNVREQLQKGHTVDTYLFRVDLNAIRLKLSGMRGQLDLLEAAFAHACDLVTQCQTLGVLMDRQEKSVEEAKDTIAALSAQVGTVGLRLKQRFAEPRHEAVSGLIACFEDFIAFAGAGGANESAVELAARLKHQTLNSLYLLKGVYDGLQGT